MRKSIKFESMISLRGIGIRQRVKYLVIVEKVNASGARIAYIFFGNHCPILGQHTGYFEPNWTLGQIQLFGVS
jgi:hypothetical protein